MILDIKIIIVVLIGVTLGRIIGLALPYGFRLTLAIWLDNLLEKFGIER